MRATRSACVAVLFGGVLWTWTWTQVPLLAQSPPTVTCEAPQLPSGACLDVLTWGVRFHPELIWITETDFIVGGSAYDREYPAAKTPMRPFAAGPGGDPGLRRFDRYADSFIARYSIDDALPDWVVPLSMSSVTRVARGPLGRIFVLGSTLSARWPDPPKSAIDEFTSYRRVLGVFSESGELLSVAFPAEDRSFWTLIGGDSAGNVITNEDLDLLRRHPRSLEVIQRASSPGRRIDQAGDEFPEIAFASAEGISLVRRDDLTTTVTIPFSDSIIDAIRVSDSALYVAAHGSRDYGACSSMSGTAPSGSVFVYAKVSLTARAVEWARYLGPWPRTAEAWPSLLRDGRLVVSTFRDAIGEASPQLSGPLYRSVDGGATWTSQSAALKAGPVTAIAFDPVDPHTMYATASESVVKTTDGGGTWRDITPSGWPAFGRVVVNPYRPNQVWVLGTSGYAYGLLWSEDSGASWEEVSNGRTGGGFYDPPAPFPSIFDPAEPDAVWRFAKYDRGDLEVSRDHGRTWSAWAWPARSTAATFVAGRPHGRRYGLIASEGRTTVVWADGGSPWTPGAVPAGFEPELIAADPVDERRAVAFMRGWRGDWYASQSAVTRDGGVSWSLAASPGPQYVVWKAFADGTNNGRDTSLLAAVFVEDRWGRHRFDWWRSYDTAGRWRQIRMCVGCDTLVGAPGDPDVLMGFGPRAVYRLFEWFDKNSGASQRRAYVPNAHSRHYGFPGLGDALVEASFDTDLDGDGLPNGWERQYGPEAQSRLEDPDLDGASNAEELAAGTHPVGRHSLVCAEGGTSAAFVTRLDMFNPDPTRPARVLVRFGADLDPESRRFVAIPPGAARAVDLVDDVRYFKGGEHPLLVDADVPLTVTRTMTWGDQHGSRVSQHAGSCVTPRARWQFAEGSTAAGFQLFFVMVNSGTVSTTVRATFLRLSPLPPVERSYELAPGERVVVWANLAVPELANGDVAAVFEAPDDTPIVVERSMYWPGPDDGAFGGGTTGHGLEPATDWWIAEGVENGQFASYVPLSNATASPADVRVTLIGAAGEQIVRRLTVPGRSRVTFVAADVASELKTPSFAAHVEVTNGVSIVAERATWWSHAPGTSWWRTLRSEGHASEATSRTAASWMAAGGAAGDDVDAYVLIGKFSDAPATVTITLRFADGGTLARDIDLGSGPRRESVRLFDLFTSQAIDGRAFAVVVSAADAAARLVVELSQYRSTAHWWSAGTSVMARPVQP